MKVLIVGASGMIGGEALLQCLSESRISKVVAFVRRNLPAQVSEHPKLECITIKDFAIWPEAVLQAHAEAAAMIWAMGTYTGNTAADLEYPLVFIESMAETLKTVSRANRFRYIHLSGKFVRQDQEEKLWFLETPRKLKGLMETRALEFAENNANIWETFILKPGGVVAKDPLKGIFTFLTATGVILGKNWSVRVEELGAYMAYLAMGGEEEQSLINNARIVRKGRQTLDSRTDST
ncbi:hypothetical protein Purlil1_10116 [Purpureocillium lilacinum]|uniref:NAD(P)-binding domain-containing protein n=1 Tax=Purpureocillium lilacinum TaxID=33203 RepID=A0ABR0BNI4_PURLI|nr:hypothetical protein Purlil1_10116 [Purpureocillium lilacinum]